jgi:transcriptional regulator with XRE-family HTH domain
MNDPAVTYIRHVLEAKGWTAADLSRHAGVAHSTINRPLTIADYPNAISRQTIGKVYAASGIDPAPFFAEAGGPSFLPLPVAFAPPDADLVNVYAIQASAGYGAWVDDYEQVADRLSFPPGYLAKITKANPRDLVIIGVKGDSMIPTLNDDDVVMVDTSKTSLGFDGLFVFSYDGVLQVKRVGRSGRKGHVTITSDNRALYPPFEALAEDVKVVGKVVWMGVKV